MSTSKIRVIPYTYPSITELEVQYATDAASNGWGDHCYDYIVRFEEAFKPHLGVKYAIATSSCTGALHMGMHALGIGPGDEVIMADTNWIGTAAPIVHLGATPVFEDILPDSWCLDPEQVEAAITPKPSITELDVRCATDVAAKSLRKNRLAGRSFPFSELIALRSVLFSAIQRPRAPDFRSAAPLGRPPARR